MEMAGLEEQRACGPHKLVDWGTVARNRGVQARLRRRRRRRLIASARTGRPFSVKAGSPRRALLLRVRVGPAAGRLSLRLSEPQRRLFGIRLDWRIPADTELKARPYVLVTPARRTGGRTHFVQAADSEELWSLPDEAVQ